MKRATVMAAIFALSIAAGSAAAPAESVLFTFTGLRGAVDTCQWFDDNLNDRSVDALTRQTDLLYNRVALPVGAPVTIVGTATAASGDQLVAFKLGSTTLCSNAEAIYGPTPSPSASP
jgi:hypothetical protein